MSSVRDNCYSWDYFKGTRSRILVVGNPVKDTASNANSNRSLSKLKMDDDKGALLDAYQMLIRCYRKAAAHMLLKAKDIIEFGPFDEMYAKRLVKDCDPNTALPCDEGEEGYAVCFDGPLKVGKPDFSMTVNGKNLEGLLVSKMVGAGRKRKRKNNTAVHEPMVPPQPSSRVRQAKREKRPNLRRRVTLHTNTRVPPDTIRRIKYGTRSRMDAKAWTCKGCGQVNRPVRYIIADLPPLRCINKKCNKPLPDDYEFSFTMARACVNGSCPIGNIKDQEQTDECSLYNTCGALEITERMAKLLVGEVPCGKDAEGPILSTKDLLAKFEEMMRLHDINTGWGDNKFNITTLLAACDIAVLEGIKHLDDHEAVPRVHKASGKRRVPCRFSEIAKKLANGTPLIGVINTGKKFGDLKNGHIYKAPPNKDVPGKRTGYHCIVLIGAGKRRKCYFYHFLNSYGELFCLRIRETKKRSLKISRGGIHKGKVKKFVGGFGKVRADDLLEEPVEFLRYPDSSVTNELWVPRRDLDAGNIDDLIMNVNFCSEWTRRMDARTS